MRFRTPTQPTSLTPTQAARLRTLDIRLLATSAAVHLAVIALTFTPWPIWIILPLTVAAYTPVAVQFIRFRASLGLKRMQALIPEYPSNLLHTGAFMSFAMLAGLCMYAIVTGEASGFMLLLVPCMGIAMTLLNASNFSFALSPPSCPSCHYPLEGLTFPLTCPECGHPISSKSEAITYRKLNKPGLRIAGVACLVLPLLGSTVFSANPGLITTRLPRPAQLALAPTDTAAFNSIVATLNPEERDHLITRILDHRREGKPFRINAQIDWLADQFANQTLTPQQAQRFVLEGTDPRLFTESQPRVGQALPLIFSVDTDRSRIGSVNRVYFIRSLTAGDQTILQNDTTLRVPAFIFEPVSSRFLPSIPMPPPRPFQTFTPTTPGPTTIRLETVVITTLGNYHSTITWHDDNTYTITPQPLTTNELTAETTLEITP